MECNDKYVLRVSNKYNRRHVISFVQKRAEKRFLAPLGLALKQFPPASFGNNTMRMNCSEEFELFTALHYMKYKITKTKIQKCRDRYLQIYFALRNRGISANCPLVFDCIKRHSGRFRNTDRAKLIEQGYTSLISTVDGFDPWAGNRFSTYACISITRSFYNRAEVVRSTAPIEEANEVGIKVSDEKHELYIERMNFLLQSDSLNQREKEVLNCRFQENLTLKEVGKIWGITKERVRQIQIEALLKLRDALSKDAILS